MIHRLLYVFLIVANFSCNKSYPQKEISIVTDKTNFNPAFKESKIDLQFSESELHLFLDSIGELSPKQWIDSVKYWPDYNFSNSKVLDRVISENDFEVLKNSSKSKTIDSKTAKRIFNNNDNLSYEGNDGEISDSIPLVFFSFNLRDEFNEFAVYPGSVNGNSLHEIYFFNSNHLIEMHTISNHYNGLDLMHFKDRDSKTVVYYEVNHLRGTGVSWNNIHFYKYDANKLIPVLNILKSSHGNSFGRENSNRNIKFNSYIEQTNPLTIKFIFSQDLADSHYNMQNLTHGSATIKFNWNEHVKIFEGDYSKVKIDESQILTYYMDESIDLELLFIHSHYKILKHYFNKKNSMIYPALIIYLNKIKNTVVKGMPSR